MTPWLPYPRIPAAYHRPRNGTVPNLIVCHSMESPEKPGTARGVANWFAGRLGPPPVASAHFCVGPDEVIQCVPLDEQGAHAPGANRRSVGIEMTGRASQTAEQWADTESRSMLTRSARLCAELVRELDIPPVRLDFAAVRAGAPGICGHHDVTLAFPDRGHGHYDPGPAFPWDAYMASVADELAKRATDPAPPIAPDLPTLRLGSTGEAVRLLQERLRLHGFLATVDGSFGPATEAAVRRFQKSVALGVDGVVGAISWAALLEDP